jgi:hypothetical protein
VCWYLNAKIAPMAAAINGIAIFSKTSVNVICQNLYVCVKLKAVSKIKGLVNATIINRCHLLVTHNVRGLAKLGFCKTSARTSADL